MLGLCGAWQTLPVGSACRETAHGSVLNWSYQVDWEKKLSKGGKLFPKFCHYFSTPWSSLAGSLHPGVQNPILSSSELRTGLQGPPHCGNLLTPNFLSDFSAFPQSTVPSAYDLDPSWANSQWQLQPEALMMTGTVFMVVPSLIPLYSFSQSKRGIPVN